MGHAALTLPWSVSSKPTMTLLQPSDFSYQGCLTFPPSITGMQVRGFARRPETNTYFVVGANPAGMMYPLFELHGGILSPTLGGSVPMRICRYWGDLNQHNALYLRNPDGTPAARQDLKSLHWDAKTQTLWAGFGSFYANGENLPCIAAAKIDAASTSDANSLGIPAVTPGLSVVGTWAVPQAVHSDRVKGCFLAAPDSLRQATGNPFMAFGVTGSTIQGQSLGPGLVSIADPLSVSPGSEVAAKIVTNWPAILQGGYIYSKFPRNNLWDYLSGGGDTGKPEAVSAPNGGFQQGDGVSNFSWIETSSGKAGLIYFGSLGYGHLWYGDWDQYIDRPSLLYPAMPCQDANRSRGTHSEARLPMFWLVDPIEVIGAVASGNQEVAAYSEGSPHLLGRNVGFVPQLSEQSAFGDHHWDAASGRLQVLTHGSDLPNWISCVNVWKVN